MEEKSIVDKKVFTNKEFLYAAIALVSGTFSLTTIYNNFLHMQDVDAHTIEKVHIIEEQIPKLKDEINGRMDRKHDRQQTEIHDLTVRLNSLEDDVKKLKVKDSDH